MSNSTFLKRYLEKIGFIGEPSVDYETLKSIHRLHLRTFAFENLTPLSGETVSLDKEVIRNKFLNQGRGGYCFEQNSLLRDVLEEIGFKVTSLMGRVNVENRIPGRTHMVLIIMLNGKRYLADVGFGGLGVPQPIELILDKEQKTNFESYRIISEDNLIYHLQIYFEDKWKTLYAFDFVPYYQGDFEVGNWYTSNHPTSSFRKQIKISRIDNDKRLTLNNTVFSVYHYNGKSERRNISDLTELIQLLETEFLIQINPDNSAIISALNTILKNEMRTKN